MVANTTFYHSVLLSSALLHCTLLYSFFLSLLFSKTIPTPTITTTYALFYSMYFNITTTTNAHTPFSYSNVSTLRTSFEFNAAEYEVLNHGKYLILVYH